MDRIDLKGWKQSLKHSLFIEEVVVDTRRISSKKTLFVALPGKHFDGHNFLTDAARQGAVAALVSEERAIDPALFPTLKLITVNSPLEELQSLAAYYRSLLPTKIIAITGSYGKTMLKDLLSKLLKPNYTISSSPESFNSQIGVPLTLFRVGKNDQLAVIEAGISKPGEMARLREMIQPHYVIIANIGTAHLDTLHSLERTAEEKYTLLDSLPKKGWALLPEGVTIGVKEELPTAHWSSPCKISLTFPSGSRFEHRLEEPRPYILNLLLLASRAAYLLGISEIEIGNRLFSSLSEPMQSEIWLSPQEVTVINDTYCNDPLSVESSLETHLNNNSKGRVIFVFGGFTLDGKESEQDLKRVLLSLNQFGVDKIFLYNKDHLQIIKKKAEQEVIEFYSLDDLLQKIHPLVKSGDTLLFKSAEKIPLKKITKAFGEVCFNNRYTINLASIRYNIALIKSNLSPSTRMMVMVKAQGYGTCETTLSRYLEKFGIDILGVSYIDEAIKLRKQGISADIFVINIAPYEVSKAFKWDVQVGVEEVELIDLLEDQGRKEQKTIKVHLAVNSGMVRFGCRPEEALKLAQQIENSEHLILEGIMTHFSCSNDPKEKQFTKEQAKVLTDLHALLKKEGINVKYTHAANSEGTLSHSFPQFNMVRLGISIFGYRLSPTSPISALPLKPALSLTSHIISISECRRGETIGYGKSYRIEKEKVTVATLPIGYYDGIHLHYSGKGEVIINGKKAPLIGGICMDHMMVDVTAIPNVKIGTSVLIFGEDNQGHSLSPESFAEKGETILHELITCLGPRIQRVFIFDESGQRSGCSKKNEVTTLLLENRLLS